MRNTLGLYQKNADLIAIGAYKKGTDPKLDEAVDKYPAINDFLMQGTGEAFSYEDTVMQMKEIITNLKNGSRRHLIVERCRLGIHGQTRLKRIALK